MENVGKMMSEGEWNISHEMYSSSSSPDEEANFMAQLLGNSSLPSDQCWSLQESAKMDETSIYSSSSDEYTHFYQGSNTNGFNGSFHFPPSLSHHHQILDSQDANSMDQCYGFLLINQLSSFDGSMKSNEINNDNDHQVMMNDLHGINLHLRTSHDDMMMIPMNNDDQSHSSLDEKVSSPSLDIAKKRSRVPMANIEKDERSLRQKKKQKVASLSSHEHEEEDDDEKISNTTLKRQNSMINCCSADEDDSMAPSKCNTSKRGGAIPNKNGKARASRGSATDPQSLYARKRRERINERLKILQNLVPNGTKVDISTMLEEAVQYVKFLQVQIKLLSSNDLWMYAPIAYNGMDMGLDLKIATANKSQSQYQN